jgi:hypothetical protein
MKDICDGAVHQKLQTEILEPFLTMTLNVDGVQPNKGSKQTIWPALLVINELPLKKRFAIENIVVGGVWPGPNKPSRTEMRAFLRPVIDELVMLEQGVTFLIHDDDNTTITARIFLIGACCDKPAQSILQFLPEPTAAYGCGRCEVPGRHIVLEKKFKKRIFIGFTVKTVKNGNVQSFAMTMDSFEKIHLRSNTRYDALLNLKLLHEQIKQSFPARKRKALIKQHKADQKGILGCCILRELSYFDVGHSFMADSLHNVYIGCFVG